MKSREYRRESIIFSSGGARWGGTKSDLKAGQGRPTRSNEVQGPFPSKRVTVVKFCFPKLQKLKLSSTVASRSSKIRQIQRNLEHISIISSNLMKSREYRRESIIFSSGGARGWESKSTLRPVRTMAERWPRPFCSKT